MNRALLEKPFAPAQIRQRKGRNGVLDYVEGYNVIARLNEALDGAWSFEITHHEVREDEVVVEIIPRRQRQAERLAKSPGARVSSRAPANRRKRGRRSSGCKARRSGG